MGVTPAQVGVDLAGQGWLARGSLLPTTKLRSGPKCGSIGLAQDASVGVKHRFTLCFAAQQRILAVRLPDQLSRIT
ncbi:hypothetical protein AB0O76_39785 [Streptomyces sp. NPDC086554]|uniref:hypothetical protein n=1 Tax=Streptomyces sp. NPDC086554 TaxID=3154864 RepID=UPI003445A9BB